MSKDDLLINIYPRKNIYNEYKYIEKIPKDNMYQKIEKKYLFEEKNLSDVIAAIRRARSQSMQPQSQPRATSTGTQQSVITPSRGSIQPSNITSARRLWSPVSTSGIVYKYNRGVIGIGLDGTKYEIIFDGTLRHHNEATAEIGVKTNCPVTDKNANPFFNGMEVSQQGTIIIQLEGDSMLVYLPETISEAQFQSIETEIIPRSNFSTVAYSHGNDIYDDPNVNVETLRQFYGNIINASRRVTR